MAIYAYTRAQQKGQSLNKQIQSFLQFGVQRANVFVDEQPSSRSGYGEVLQTLKRGDLLVIKSLNSLGDGYGAISTEWSRITGSIGADIYVTDMPAIDTRLGSDREVISSVVVQLMNFCNEKARKQSTLQAKGIQAARQRGVKFGRPKKSYSDEFIETVSLFCEKKLTLEEALTTTGMKQSSFYYHVKRLKEMGLVRGK